MLTPHGQSWEHGVPELGGRQVTQEQGGQLVFEASNHRPAGEKYLAVPDQQEARVTGRLHDSLRVGQRAPH